MACRAAVRSAGSQSVRPAHRFWRTHLVHLFRTAGVAQPETRTDVLLAALTAEQVGWWLREGKKSVRALTRELQAVAITLVTG